MALWLSLMVVYLSVGTTVMHCLRYDKVMVGALPDCCVNLCTNHECYQGHGKSAQIRKHCMDVRQLKLSPTISIQNVDFDSAPVFAGIPMGTWSLVPRPVVYNIQKWRGWNTNTPHSPPREYLSILNRLII